MTSDGSYRHFFIDIPVVLLEITIRKFWILW
jgi:hypothetical protein